MCWPSSKSPAPLQLHPNWHFIAQQPHITERYISSACFLRMLWTVGSSKCRRAWNEGRAGVGQCARAPNLGRPGKVTLESVALLIIVRIRKKQQNHTRSELNVGEMCTFCIIHGTRTCSSSRYESRAPERVYSRRRWCRDCGARGSNDARGQDATVVYARVAHGPSGGGKPRRPPHLTPGGSSYWIVPEGTTPQPPASPTPTQSEYSVIVTDIYMFISNQRCQV